MFVSLLKDAVGCLASVAEVGLVIAAVLLIGLLLGMSGFWILGRLLGKLGGPPPPLDPLEDEPEGSHGTNSPLGNAPGTSEWNDR
jgi:hypothetical protein